MGKINRFEDIIAWQKARELNKLVYQATLLQPFVRDFALVDQIRRSSISILSNIAEGFERKGVQEFIHFLNIAKASSAELRAQLYVASDLEYISIENSNKLITDAATISRMLSSLMKYLEENKDNGLKFHEPESEYRTQ
ncbi:MAG: four helix bundle protein [Bacteroidetes bacterium]|jgi:four helix bundle protein|nr:four helix bundle protein [Bacteroidota bacterium]